MATSIGLICLLGLSAHWLFTKCHLPGLLGMLVVGMVLGPYGLNIVDVDLLVVSAEFRKIALIVILLRAGLGISRDDLNAIGATAVKLSVIPGIFEGTVVLALAMWLFDMPFYLAGVLGFIVAAVSPAVIVPYMLRYKDQGYGTNKRIPTLVLAGASVDDVIAITLFSSFLGLHLGQNQNLVVTLLGIPLSIVLGLGLGGLIGLALVRFFEKHSIRDTKKVLIILGLALMLTALEGLLKSKLDIAGLLGVMAIGFVLLEKRPLVAKRLSLKFNKIWIFAEILLFVLVGAQVDLALAVQAGGWGLLIIGAGLVARSCGVWLATWGSNLSLKERLFVVIAYLPKATVQAAIGAIPLSYGINQGDLILALAVLSIVVTAPLSALLMDHTHKKLLQKTP